MLSYGTCSDHQPQYCITYQRHRKMFPQREAPFCAWYRGCTFSHCKDSRCLQKANAYTHTCTYKSSLNNSHHVLWPQQNTQTRDGALDPPLPMPLHMHEALARTTIIIYAYVHVNSLDTHARVKCVASTYGTYAHSYYECHIITTYTVEPLITVTPLQQPPSI